MLQELTGAEVNRERYSEWLRSWQRQRTQGSVGLQQQQLRQQQQARLLQQQQVQQQGQQPGDPGSDAQALGGKKEGLERIKWFLGLPNSYYSSD